MRYAGLILCATVTTAGCGAAPDGPGGGLATHVSQTRTHAIAGKSSGADGVATVEALSRHGVETTATVTTTDGVRTGARLEFNGAMDDGTTAIASSGNLPAAQNGKSFGGGDTFLEALADVPGNGFLGRYVTRSEGNQTTGYLVAGEKSASVPVGGTAEFRGQAFADLVGSVSGHQTATADLTLKADFTPAGANVHGETGNLTVAGSEKNMRLVFGGTPPGLDGTPANSFDFGFIQVEETGPTAGTPSMNGSNYRGAFHGENGAAIAGTFWVDASNVSALNGTAEDVFFLGGFAGNKK
jgi:hypothetical protein